MKKMIAFLIVVLSVKTGFAQEIVNLVLVGNNGITEDIKEAHSFIVVKKYPNSFQRLDYKLQKPLERVSTYSDSSLTILQGPFYEYASSGRILKSGDYENNQKAKSWYYYNDTGKIVLEEKYENGVLIKTIDPDTVKKEPISDKLQDGEREAVYGKSDQNWIKYLSKALNPEIGNQSVRGGKVIVRFVVSTSGKCVDVHLEKSVEFVLDNEALRVIESSPLWEPAVQGGRKVNAYRRQPLSFVKE